MIKKYRSDLFLIISIIFFLTILILKFFIQEKTIQPFGISILEISSNSMNPTLYKGDKIIIKKQEEYEEGDIITYISKENNCITHRIVYFFSKVYMFVNKHIIIS